MKRLHSKNHSSFRAKPLWCFFVLFAFAAGSLRVAADQSIARVWNEEVLAAIRIDTPHPPVQARNIFSLSVAMYDAWAAYDDQSIGWVYREKHFPQNVPAARHEAISYAAYRILRERYALSKSASNTLARLDARMLSLGYPTNNFCLEPSTPAGVGNLVFDAVSSFFLSDGCLQTNGYADITPQFGGYAPINQPLVTRLPGTTAININRWQPLGITNAVDQNGFPAGPIQSFLGSQWIKVRPFALARSDSTLPWYDPGPFPRLGGQGDAKFREEVVDVIRRSSELTPDDGVEMDISPGAYGNNSLGANDGKGHVKNPHTGLPYKPNIVRRGDFTRVLAEFWADGPHSETPPGHWNVIANAVADHPQFTKRIGGVGEAVDDLEWDVKTYFALNGALHDAACAAWSLKCYYDGGRPIQFIRYMGQRGQSTNPKGPSFHPLGLPLVSNLIEVVSIITTQPGQRHAGLVPGTVVIRTWPGQPKDFTNAYSGVRWIPADVWMPYQKANFVSPAFPGYISGHSTFSRAAAELLASFTASPFFPGGLGTFTGPSNTFLTFERGPSRSVELQWATYFDAADQAGLSRLWGGIHVEVDDLTGRRVGHQCGQAAWALANRYFDGSITNKAPVTAVK